MATIGREENGHKRILFVGDDGSRKTIRLGKCTEKQAEAIKTKIEALVAAIITGQQDDEVSRWIGGCHHEIPLQECQLAYHVREDHSADRGEAVA